MILVVGAFIFACIIIWWAWTETVHTIKTSIVLSGDVSDNKTELLAREKSALIKVKGLYLTAYSAGNPKKVDEIISLIDKTELNAVVIDIKDYSGKVLYDSRVKLVNDLKIDENRLGNVQNLIKKFHAKNIYVIARQTVFQDPILAEKKPEWAIKNKSGNLWRDHKGLAWVDPSKKEVWSYNVAIAKEAIGFGFDEINFDYVRFPSDGDMSQAVYAIGNEKKYEVMGKFYHFLNIKLEDQPAWISLDMFGLVMEKHGEDDMRIGQRLADAVGEVDYISPMMYPSHYPSGHLGLTNPADHPAAVFKHGMKLGTPKFVGKRAKVRPWIQAFNVGAIYDAGKMRAQIDEIEKYPENAGWLAWNAANRYTASGLNK
ncbi:MAG: Uncharacterized protein G01um101413_58 [Parcubacteria group bacterium Gr01-1014_13]|nr:MAG: Uncharacterized protein G01um101413_58 [Parcubacteria group bacterium Gr01-1014_13]